MLSSALVLAALVHHAALESSDALAPSLHRSHRSAGCPSALSYSNAEHGGESYFSPLPDRLQRRGESDHRRRLQQEKQEATEAAHPHTAGQQRHIPRRAMPHVQIASNAEAATRAGYIIRPREMSQGRIPTQQKQLQNGVRPLRSIRRIVHRSSRDQTSNSQGMNQEEPSRIGIQAPDATQNTRFRNRTIDRISRLSLSKQPQLDEFLDKPEKLPPVEKQRKGARRVTFKATRESTKSLISKPVATLTEYMTQPVSQYSLLSFHDAEESNDSNQPKSRRWLVRRLTTEESQHYIQSVPSNDDAVMDELNLFRLAVPLLPLIGWDLTPVIDLEVIPPKLINELAQTDNDEQAKWEPLKGIRKRIRSRGDGQMDTEDGDAVEGPPAVKVRSLRVSLLSTQEEVKEAMSNNNNNTNSRRDRTMQKEAIEMVGKVEEWLRPHITFEAELSWNDGLTNSGVAQNESSVTVKSTAITSLTIPKIPTEILRATVPSAFLVKRLGATLTSQALAICLPRFLRQLEKDYDRWSGLGLSANSVEGSSSDSRN